MTSILLRNEKIVLNQSKRLWARKMGALKETGFGILVCDDGEDVSWGENVFQTIATGR